MKSDDIERCETCKSFERRRELNSAAGRCHLNPPTADGFPIVRVTDWCGQFKLKQEEVNLVEGKQS